MTVPFLTLLFEREAQQVPFRPMSAYLRDHTSGAGTSGDDPDRAAPSPDDDPQPDGEDEGASPDKPPLLDQMKAGIGCLPFLIKVFLVFSAIVAAVVLAMGCMFVSFSKDGYDSGQPEVSVRDSGPARIGTDEEEQNGEFPASTPFGDNLFFMPVQTVRSITGRGTVVSGVVESGSLNVGDSVSVIGLDREEIVCVVGSLEADMEMTDAVSIGDNAGVVLEDVTIDDVARGMTIVSAHSIGAVSVFRAEIQLENGLDEDLAYINGEHQGGTSDEDPQADESPDVTCVIGGTGFGCDLQVIESGDDTLTALVTLDSSAGLMPGMEVSIELDGDSIARGIVTEVG